jgi:hypothetical protein
MTQRDEAKQPDTVSDATPAEEAVPAAEVAVPEPKGRPWGILVALAAVVALVLAGVATWPQWKDKLTPASVVVPAPAPEAAAPPADALRAEIGALRARVAELESRPAIAQDQPDMAPLDRRLTQVEGAVESLRTRPQVPDTLVQQVDALGSQVAELRKTAADSSAVLRIADRLDKVEAELRDMRSRRTSAAALLLAVGQLREAVNHAMPFEAELRAVRALAPQDAELAQAVEALKPRAAAGIPTRAVLADRFEALAPALVRSDLLPQGQSWWRDTVDRMSSLLTVRREDGEAAGDSPAAVVARAQAALRRGDLAAAIAQAETLSGAAGESVAPWLADARARLAADKALSLMTAQVVAAIGPQQ